MTVSEVGPRGDPEFSRVFVRTLGTELSKAVRGIGPRTHEGLHSYRLRSNTGKDVKGMGRENIREVRDYSNAVPHIRSLVGRSVSGWRGMRKSRGGIRT